MRKFCLLLLPAFAILLFSCGPMAHCTHRYLFKGIVSNQNNDPVDIEITNIGDAFFGIENARKDKGFTRTNDFFVKGDYYTTCSTKPALIKNSEASIEITITKNGTNPIQKKLDNSSFYISENDSLTIIDIGNIDLYN